MRPERSKQYCLQLYIYIYIYIFFFQQDQQVEETSHARAIETDCINYTSKNQ